MRRASSCSRAKRATPAGVGGGARGDDARGRRRVIVVDGVERWREADVERQLAPAIGRDAARDDARAVRARGGAREGAGGAARGGQARRRAGRRADDGQAVGAAEVGARAGRRGSGCRSTPRRRRRSSRRSASASSGCCASSRSSRSKATRRAAGERAVGRRRRSSSARRTRPSGARTRSPTRSSAPNAREATLAYLRLREQGERLSGLIYLMAQRLRDALAVARAPAGRRVARRTVKRGLRMPPRAAERFVADVARSDPARLRAALGALADLELDSRGGAVIAADRDAARGARRGHARAARDRGDHGLDEPVLPSERLGGGAGAQARGAGLLARAGVAVQRAALDGLVDRADELAVRRVGGGVVAVSARATRGGGSGS